MKTVYRNAVWNEQVTIFHKVDEIVSGKKVTTWEKSVYEGCFWQLKDKRALDGQQIVAKRLYIVRIPIDRNEEVIVDVGDVAVKGSVEETIETTPTELLKAHQGESFLINSVTDNRKLRMTAHWLLSDNR